MISAGAAGAMMAWNPLRLGSKLKCWLRADKGITLTSGAVSTWADQSGNGFDFTQSTAGKRPTVGALGGRTNVLFDGTDDALTNAGNLSNLIDIATPKLHIIVDFYASAVHSSSSAALNNAATNVALLGNTPGYQGVSLRNVSSGTSYAAIPWTFQAVVGYHGTETTMSLNTRNVLGYKVTGGVGTSRLNNGTAATDGSVGPVSNGGGPMKIGENFNASRWYQGGIAEVIICNDAMTSTEEALCRQYLGLTP